MVRPSLRIVRRLMRRHRPEHPAGEVYIPIKYDLGGRITDVPAAQRELARICGEVTEAGPLTRSWNLSYFGRYSPSFSGRLEGGTVTLGGSDWRFERTLVLHPSLGVASVNYHFTTDDPGVRLRAFYDDFIRWKNSDYFPYLTSTGVVTPALRRQIGHHPDPPHDLHGETILRLRQALAPYLDARPAPYAFHDFRVCFVDRHGTLRRSTINSLLLFSRETPAEAPLVDAVRVDAVQIESTGWSTVVVCGPGSAAGTVDDVLALMSVVHAHWYVGKVWINIYDDHIVRSGNRHSQRNLHKLRSAQLLLAKDLSDAGDLDQMLKDPAKLRIARYFVGALQLPAQMESAERRRRVLEEHARELVEFRSSNQLQNLFAIAAAVGVTALIPALADIGWDPGASVWTAILTVVLIGVFAVNLASVAESFRFAREAARRRRRRR